MQPSPRPPVELLGPADVAQRLGVSARWVRAAAASGRLPHHRVGRLIRFDPADVDDFLSRSRVERAS